MPVTRVIGRLVHQSACVHEHKHQCNGKKMLVPRDTIAMPIKGLIKSTHIFSRECERGADPLPAKGHLESYRTRCYWVWHWGAGPCDQMYMTFNWICITIIYGVSIHRIQRWKRRIRITVCISYMTLCRIQDTCLQFCHRSCHFKSMTQTSHSPLKNCIHIIQNNIISEVVRSIFEKSFQRTCWQQ